MLTFCACSLLLAASTTWAAPVPAQVGGHVDRRALADWDRSRDSWSSLGIELSLGYVNEWLHNVSGGERSTSAYADQIMVGADFNLDKIVGWSGASFHVVVTNRNGPQLDAAAGLGTLLETHEIFGRGHYTRLTRFFLKQELLRGRVILKLGRGDVDFFPFSCDFINISFCGALPGYHSNGWYTWPIGQYFANITLQPHDTFYVKLGANEVNPRNLEGDQGMRLTTLDDDNDGTLANVEVGWTPRFRDGLDGAYRLGIWRDSTNYPDLLLNERQQPLPIAGGVPLIQYASSGLYVMLQQQVTRNELDGGLSLFMNLSRSEASVNRVDRLISVGLWYTGIFAARPKDRIGLALGHSRVSSRLREFERISNELDGLESPDRRYEMPMELNYGFYMLRGLWLMPSLQIVRDPGGDRDARDARIVGLKFLADF